ncbi:MAG: beta strand repeat-containing protein, partial [Burkholderiales bacterium]
GSIDASGGSGGVGAIGTVGAVDGGAGGAGGAGGTVNLSAAAGAVGQTSGSIQVGTLHAKAATGIHLTNVSAGQLSALNTTSGDISITANSSSSLTTVGSPFASGYAIRNQAPGGNVILTANSMNFSDPGLISAAATVVLRPATSWTDIDLGAAPSCTGGCDFAFSALSSSSTLLLTSADLSRVSAPTLEIGDNDASGSIAINAPITLSSVSSLVLKSAGHIWQDAGSPVTVNSLALDAGDYVDMQADNMVGTLAGSASGDFIFTNAQSLTIGLVAGYDGVSVDRGFFIDGGEGANIKFAVNNGSLTVNQPVIADAGTGYNPGAATVSLSATGITVNGDGGYGGNVEAYGGSCSGGCDDGAAKVDVASTNGDITLGGNISTSTSYVDIGPSIRLSALNGAIIGAGGVLSASGDGATISLSALTGIGQVGNPVRINDRVASIYACNGSDISCEGPVAGAAGDIALSQVTGDVLIDNDIGSVTNWAPDRGYDVTVENGSMTLGSGSPISIVANGNGNIGLRVLSPGKSLIINAGAMLGTTNGQITLQADELALGGDPGSVNAGPSGSVILKAGAAGVAAAPGLITAGALEVQSGGTVSITGNNQVGTIAANVTGGSFSFENQLAGGLTIGAVGETTGVTAPGLVNITQHPNGESNPEILVSGTVSSSSGDVNISAGNGITQHADITAYGNITLTANANGGTGNFTQYGGSIANVGTVNPGNITVNAYDIQVGATDSKHNVVLNAAHDIRIVSSGFLGGGTAQNFSHDDSSFAYTLPFGFTYYGVPYTTMYVSSNGVITFGGGAGQYTYGTDQSIWNAALIAGVNGRPTITPAWSDWVTYSSLGKDIYIHQPSAGALAVRWDVANYGDRSYTANFETVLSQSGNIAFNYGAATAMNPDYTATIGVSSGDGVHYTLSTLNNPASLNNLSSTQFNYSADTGNYIEPLVPGVLGGGSINALAGVSLAAAGILNINNTISAASINGQSAGITLGITGALTASGAGDAIVLNAGAGNFINDAGAAALSNTGGGRWLIYSASPSGVTKNGLTSNFRHYNATYGSYGPDSVTESGNGFIYASAAGNLTVTTNLASGTASNTYGVTPTASFGYTLAGFADSEDSAGNIGLAGAAAFTPTLAATTNAASYTVAYASGLTSSLGYGFVAGPGVGYTVNRAPLTAHLSGTISKPYDGGLAAALTS